MLNILDRSLKPQLGASMLGAPGLTTRSKDATRGSYLIFHDLCYVASFFIYLFSYTVPVVDAII